MRKLILDYTPKVFKVLQLDYDWFNDPAFYYRLTNALHKIRLDDEIDRLNGKLSWNFRLMKHSISSHLHR